MFSDLFEHVLKEVSGEEFEDLFQPVSQEEYSSRTMDYIKSVCTQNPGGTWSCEGDVDLSDRDLKKLPVKFRRVAGNFYCSRNKLTSLEGAPEEIGGDLICSDNPTSEEELIQTISRS